VTNFFFHVVTSRAQTRESERQILRPPPFPQAALNKVDEGDNKQVDKGMYVIIFWWFGGNLKLEIG